MKRKILIICAVSSIRFGFAQQVIANSGESLSVSQYASVNFTLGETVIETVSNVTNDLTQGFHQTKWSFISIEENTIPYSVSVYPNPFQDELILELTDANDARYQLLDINGKIVLEKVLESTKNSIQTGDLSAGTYTLVIQDQKNRKTFKLIKN